MKFLRNIAICLILFVLLFSCGKRTRVIPKKEMAKIYAEMYIADQWLVANAKYRPQADTSFFYEPIFQKYGYTTEDYRKSVFHYLKDAKRYSAILESSAEIISKELKSIRAIQEAEDKKKRRLERIANYEYYDEFEDISYANLANNDNNILSPIRVELDSSKLNKTVVIKIFKDTLNFEQVFERQKLKSECSSWLDSLMQSNSSMDSLMLNMFMKESNVKKDFSKDSLLKDSLILNVFMKDSLSRERHSKDSLMLDFLFENKEILLQKLSDKTFNNKDSEFSSKDKKHKELQNEKVEKLLKTKMENVANDSKVLLDTTLNKIQL